MKVVTTHMGDLHDQAGRDGTAFHTVTATVAPGYVLGTDDAYFENHEWAKKEASTRKKLLSHRSHSAVIRWDKEIDGGWQDKDPRARVEVTCSCSGMFSYNPQRVNKNGHIPSRYVTTFNSHILGIQTKEENEKLEHIGVPEPSLIAKVHMVRITHEWWVFHVNSDLAKEVSKGTKVSYSYRGWNWKLAVKKSNGWRGYGSANSREEAVATVLMLIEKERYRGHKVEIFDTSTSIGVEAPVATIANSVRRLLDDAKDLNENASPHEVAAVLQVTSDGIIQLEMLLDLKEELSGRFSKALDLE